jgi:hypothetical protein
LLLRDKTATCWEWQQPSFSKNYKSGYVLKISILKDSVNKHFRCLIWRLAFTPSWNISVSKNELLTILKLREYACVVTSGSRKFLILFVGGEYKPQTSSLYFIWKAHSHTCTTSGINSRWRTSRFFELQYFQMHEVLKSV